MSQTNARNLSVGVLKNGMLIYSKAVGWWGFGESNGSERERGRGSYCKMAKPHTESSLSRQAGALKQRVMRGGVEAQTTRKLCPTVGFSQAIIQHPISPQKLEHA